MALGHLRDLMLPMTVGKCIENDDPRSPILLPMFLEMIQAGLEVWGQFFIAQFGCKCLFGKASDDRSDGIGLTRGHAYFGFMRLLLLRDNHIQLAYRGNRLAVQ